MNPTEIKPGIYWVGVVDWNLRNFHGYSMTRHGTTYNAFLVIDEKTTLFDTVDAKYCQQFLSTISQVIPLEKIDYLVVNHLEPDHSGSLPMVIDRIKPEKIFISKMGHKCAKARFQTDSWPLEVVNSEQTVSLGKRNVQFLETRMLHWPDSMVSYLSEDNILISQDAFGQNISSSERFDDWIDWSILKNEMAHYYANIILPFSARVPKVFEKIQKLDWKIDMIAPDHGLILKKHVDHSIQAYLEFAAQEPKEKAVICYDTMWKSTEMMAEEFAANLSQEGISVSVYNLKSWHHSDVMGDVWDCAAVLVGSPTHNNGVLPLVSDMLTYMKGLRPQNKIGFGFGSYGWSGEAPKQINEWLLGMNMEMVEEPLAVFHVPTDKDYTRLGDIAKNLAQAIRRKAKN